jgi:hypothetical protein
VECKSKKNVKEKTHNKAIAAKQGVPEEFGSSHTLENLVERSL